MSVCVYIQLYTHTHTHTYNLGPHKYTIILSLFCALITLLLCSVKFLESSNKGLQIICNSSKRLRIVAFAYNNNNMLSFLGIYSLTLASEQSLSVHTCLRWVEMRKWTIPRYNRLKTQEYGVNDVSLVTCNCCGSQVIQKHVFWI